MPDHKHSSAQSREARKIAKRAEVRRVHSDRYADRRRDPWQESLDALADHFRTEERDRG